MRPDAERFFILVGAVALWISLGVLALRWFCPELFWYPEVGP